MTDAPEPIHQPDQLIVDLASWDVVQAELAALDVVHGDVDVHPGLGLVRVRELSDSERRPLGVDELLAELRQVCAADRDGFVPAMGRNRFVDGPTGLGNKIMAEAVPEVAGESDLVAVDVPAAAAGGGAGVRIGVVDTPVRAALAESLGLRVVGDAAPAADAEPVPYRAGHGTFICGILRRHAPKAEIVLAPALTTAGARADSWDVATAMMALVEDHHVDVLNLSMGCFAPGGGAPLVMSRVIERIGGRAVVVAAAGNHGNFPGMMRGRTPRSASWPAALPTVIAVGSCDRGGQRSVFSPDVRWVDCLACGEDVVAEYPTSVQVPGASSGEGARTVPFEQGLARWSGTSFAAAVVSGAIAARTVPGTVAAPAAFAELAGEGLVVARGVTGSW